MRIRSRSTVRSGFALVETMLASAILIVALLGAAMTSIRCSYLQRSTSDYIRAHHAARSVIESLRGSDLVVRYQELAGAPVFTVGDLDVAVSFPEELLTENLGGPPPASARFRDLDADGLVDLDAASLDRGSLLPVRVRVTKGDAVFQTEWLVTER